MKNTRVMDGVSISKFDSTSLGTSFYILTFSTITVQFEIGIQTMFFNSKHLFMVIISGQYQTMKATGADQSKFKI